MTYEDGCTIYFIQSFGTIEYLKNIITRWDNKKNTNLTLNVVKFDIFLVWK